MHRCEREKVDHRQVQEAEGPIKSIDRLEPTTDEWLATVKKLRGALEQHIRKEEAESGRRSGGVGRLPSRGSGPANGGDDGRQSGLVRRGAC